MFRNEKGQFIKKEEAEKQIPTAEEIEKLEARLEEMKKLKAEEDLAKKKVETDARRAEAIVVNEAIDKYEEAKNTYNETIKAAQEEYRQKVTNAEKDLKVNEAEAEEKLNNYLKTHDSFHYTYTSKDGKRRRNYDYRTSAFNFYDNIKMFESNMAKALELLW